MKFTITKPNQTLLNLLILLTLTSCLSNKKITIKEEQELEKNYEQVGLQYLSDAQKVLAGNLISSIQKQGTVKAIEFCNINAIPLTEEVSKKHNAKIKRATDKPRNQDNKASSQELIQILNFKDQILNNKQISPTIIKSKEKVNFYFPIITNSMCLQCHGTTQDITPSVKSKIHELYPKDIAIGYKENQVRGIWSIEFINY